MQMLDFYGYFLESVHRIGVSLPYFHIPANPFRINKYESSHACTGLIALQHPVISSFPREEYL